MSDLYNLSAAALRKADKPASLKVAIVSVFRNPATESMGQVMTMIREMSDADLNDFRRIFKAELGWEFPG